jgi:signal transduction histidine kinase
MHGIQVRLKVLFVVIVTLVLAISGTYSQYTLREDLEERNSQLRQGVITRLQISLPSALWDLDRSKVGSILEAEMLPPEVLGIRVFDINVGLFTGKLRTPSGGTAAATPTSVIEGIPVETTLVFRSAGTDSGAIKPVAVGRVVINFSRAQINAVLRAELARKLLEILVLDLALVGILSLSLRMVFEPLQQLRDGLFDLATRETDEVEELPEHRRDEFGEVVRGFNRIQRKLKSIIERTRQAEAMAHRSEQQTADAYQDLRMAQDSLVQAERLASLGGLVAGVAHEINTPVGITLTSASVLHDATQTVMQTMNAGVIKKSDILSYLVIAEESTRLIMSNAHRAAHLILSFKQIAADQTSEARRWFALKEYIEEIILSLHPRLRQTRIKVEIDCPDALRIDGYPGAFAQILTNLTMNALIHAFDADADGCILINVKQTGEWVELLFSDDGKGIPEEYLDKIFDPFFTTQRGQGGTGLGLNIVFNLVVKQFGGTISVDSVLGHGAKFTIRFPRVTPK